MRERRARRGALFFAILPSSRRPGPQHGQADEEQNALGSSRDKCSCPEILGLLEGIPPKPPVALQGGHTDSRMSAPALTPR